MALRGNAFTWNYTQAYCLVQQHCSSFTLRLSVLSRMPYISYLVYIAQMTIKLFNLSNLKDYIFVIKIITQAFNLFIICERATVINTGLFLFFLNNHKHKDTDNHSICWRVDHVFRRMSFLPRASLSFCEVSG